MGFYINQVLGINLDEGTLTLQGFITSTWNDPRVSVLLPKTGPYGTEEHIPVDEENAKQIWSPKTQIYNSMTERVRSSMVLESENFHQ